jgi:hypothetical protein
MVKVPPVAAGLVTIYNMPNAGKNTNGQVVERAV